MCADPQPASFGGLPQAAALPAASMHAIDPATQALIQRVIDSIDEPGEPAPGLSATADSVEPRPLVAKAQADPPVRNSTPAAPAPKVSITARAQTAGPRQECGARTAFSLYRCMQQQCSLAKWQRHPQCLQLKSNDSVD